jgi:2-polyprenyl-6-hydroxyphenyl methylase/3-demethylubiquinone-9 3-methyltransferase
MFRRIVSLFLSSQKWLCERLDRLLPEQLSEDGNAHFVACFVPAYLGRGLNVYDVGGGRSPFLDAATKTGLELHVTGLDISAQELSAAPKWAYDATICADISSYRGSGEADLVICQAVLEHVADTGSAMSCIASMLKPGGVALLFIPSRNAAFARLNLALPNRFKRALLHGLYPSTRFRQGFPAYYDRCTPSGIRQLACHNKLVPTDERQYYMSSYFQVLFPIYFLWRLWILAFRCMGGPDSAETFSIALRKSQDNQC